MKPLRVAFFGSPEFALPTLDALARQHHVGLVVSQPDKPAGRGLAVRRPAVARAAEAAGLPLTQPRRVKGNAELIARLMELDLDVGVTAAYGRILPPELLAVPRFGVLNVHASLLPRWRGAAPVQWALTAGDAETGITIMQTEEGLDTGPIRLQRRVPITPDDDAVTLAGRLSLLGAEVLTEALTLLAAGSLPLTPQDPAAATLAPPLAPEDGHVRWADSARQVERRHRGVAGWPGTSFGHAGRRVKVGELHARPEAGADRALADVRSVGARSAVTPPAGILPAGDLPGTVVGFDGESMLVACGAGLVELASVTPPGKAAMSARAWANGRAVKAGEVLV